MCKVNNKDKDNDVIRAYNFDQKMNPGFTLFVRESVYRTFVDRNFRDLRAKYETTGMKIFKPVSKTSEIDTYVKVPSIDNEKIRKVVTEFAEEIESKRLSELNR